MSETNRAIELNKQAEVKMGAKRWLNAIKLLTNELPIVEKDWRLSWNLGWCYFKLDRLNKARIHLIQSTKLAPENAACKWALGCVYLYRKQFKKAEESLIESLRLKDTHIARIHLALIYLKQKRLTKAEDVHLEGIKLKPHDSKRYKSYACFLSDVGREREARQMILEAKGLKRVANKTARAKSGDGKE